MTQTAWRRARVRAAEISLLAACLAGLASLPAAAGMATGDITSQPIGHYEFCKTYPAECAIRPLDLAELVMSGDVWRTVVAVNEAVNHLVSPRSDVEAHGKAELWSYPDDGFGDCEDYVLEKRRRLADTGISLANLLITVVRKPDNEGHAVLTLRTEKGDFILDNLTDEVKLWDETGYRFLKRQASYDAGRWVSVRSDQNVLVGAVN